MEKLFLISVLIMTITLVCTGSQSVDRRRHRSRARHILTSGGDLRHIHGRRTSVSTTLSSTTQETTSPVSSSTISTVFSTTREPLTNQGSILTTTSGDSASNPAPRRGSQPVESAYDQSNWDVIQRRLSNPSPEPNPQDRNRNRFRNRDSQNRPDHLQNPHVDQGQRSQQGQDDGQGQSNAQGQGQQQGQGERRQQAQSGSGSPFYNKMTAFEYLTSRQNSGGYQNANMRRNRELNRAMGEGMCEAFGKHYQAIAIGGICV